MAGLLGEIFSAGNVAKRKLTDLLGNPVLAAQQFVGNLNDRARNLNEMTAASAREGMDYGPATQRLANLMAEGYNPVGMLAPKRFVGKPLQGLPSKVDVGGRVEEFGTDQRLVDIAKELVEKKGFVYSPQMKYAEVDPQRAARIADAYAKMENNPNSPKSQKSV